MAGRDRLTDIQTDKERKGIYTLNVLVKISLKSTCIPLSQFYRLKMYFIKFRN